LGDISFTLKFPDDLKLMEGKKARGERGRKLLSRKRWTGKDEQEKMNRKRRAGKD